jgi:hypothetical protein
VDTQFPASVGLIFDIPDYIKGAEKLGERGIRDADR